MRVTVAEPRHHAPDPPHPGRCLSNSGHRERRIQQHIHSSHLHDVIFGPRRFAGHRTMPAEHPARRVGGNPTYAGRITPLSADCLVGSAVVMNIRRLIAIGLAAVAAASAAATTATAATAATASAAMTPARHAYLQQDLQRDLDAITATGVPGVLAEVRTGGGRELRGTSGVADLDSRKPVNGNGFFRVGSNTKTFISVVALQLVAEHRLSLDLHPAHLRRQLLVPRGRRPRLQHHRRRQRRRSHHGRPVPQLQRRRPGTGRRIPPRRPRHVPRLTSTRPRLTERGIICPSASKSR